MTPMKKPLQRAKRLYDVQHQLFRLEFLKLQTARYAVTRAEKSESDAFALFEAGDYPPVPPQLAARIAASARKKVETFNDTVKSQVDKTVDQARKESAAKKRLETEEAEFAKAEAKNELEDAIEALLARKRT